MNMYHMLTNISCFMYMSTVDLVGAGTDTISITLLWIFAILCHYPEVQEKAAKEIDEFIALNQRTPDFTERTQVPYCISVIKECMRFRPTTPFGVPHSVVNDGMDTALHLRRNVD